MQKIIGLKLKKAREETGLNQGAFAKALGLSSQFISFLESGRRAPSLDTLNKIASYLNKDMAYFFEEKGDAFDCLFKGEGLDKKAIEVFKKFRRYCEEYLQIEESTSRRLVLAPLYSLISAERMADEERRRLGLGDESIRDIFGLVESNGLRIFRYPIPEESKVAGVFIYLEEKAAAFALINGYQSFGRQVYSVAHEYGHYLKNRLESPIVDNPDVFIDEYVSLYSPREQFAQAFARRFLMPPAKVNEIIEKDIRSRKLTYGDVLYLKRYFAVSTDAMLRTLKDMAYLSRAQLEEYFKLDADRREKELFGNLTGEGESGWLSKIRKRAVLSERYKLLAAEAVKKKK